MVTKVSDGSVVDPFAVKSLVIKTSMEPGPTMLLAYTGLAELWGRMPMGRWLRETLRGVSQPMPELINLLVTQLNRKITSFNQPLVINFLIVGGPPGDERYFGAIGNTKDWQTIESKFELVMNKLDQPQLFANGSGRGSATAPKYIDLATAHVADLAHATEDHMALLAKINRGVAEANPGGPVSPYCFITGLGTDTNWTPTMRVFHKSDETPPNFHMPMIVCGIDLSNPAEQIHRAAVNRAHPTLDENQIRRNLDRRT